MPQPLTNDLSKLFSQLSEYLVHLSPPGLLNFHMWDDVGHWLYRQASTHFSILFTLLDNSVPHQVLAGVFLFASTTARSSPALLGWNCAYALFSNVSESDPPFCLLTGESVDDIRRALCNHFRSLPSQAPRHGKWAHRNRDSHFWRPRSFFLELSHFTHSRSMIRDPSSYYTPTSILLYLHTSPAD